MNRKRKVSANVLEADDISETKVVANLQLILAQSAMNFNLSLGNQNNLPRSDVLSNVNKFVIAPLLDVFEQFAKKRLKNNGEVFTEMSEIIESCKNTFLDLTTESNIEIDNDELPINTTEFKIEIDNNEVPIQEISHTSNTLSLFQEDEEILCLLKTWKLDHLYRHFTAQRITVDVLKIIKIRHLDKLLRDFDLRTQIYFEYYLQKWRASIGLPLLDMCHESSSFNHPVNGAASHLPCRPLSPSTACSTPEREIDGNNKIRLTTILNGMAKGRQLVNYYNSSNEFEEDHRLTLIRIIAEYFDEQNVPLTLPASYALEQEIIETFPSEKLEFYRTSKRGRIYNKYFNIKHSSKHLKMKAVDNKGKESDDLSPLLVPEEDAEGIVKSIKNGNVSSEEFDRLWKACSKYRINEIKKSSPIEIFNNWPEYKLPWGYRLIDIDFTVLFPNSPSIFEAWNLNENKLMEALTTKNLLNSKIFKERLKELDNLSKNSKEALLLWATHGCLVPWQKVISTDVDGKKQVTRYTIKDSQNSFIVLYSSVEDLEKDIRHKMSQDGNMIQPLLMVVGVDFNNITQIFVHLNGIKYPFNSIIKGVDVCFKIFHLFNLEYPRACITFWTFIQKYFYKINTKDNFPKVNILCNALDKI